MAIYFGYDASGNGNNWYDFNLSSTPGVNNDSLTDTPTSYGTDTGVGGEVRGNYATWNPLVLFPTTTYQSSITDGNLLMTKAGAGQGGAVTTIGATTGKFYAEATIVAVGSSAPRVSVVADANPSSINISNEFVPGYTATSVSYLSNGTRYTNATSTASWGSTFTTNDVLGIAFDADSGKVWFAKNGTWQASGNPAAGTNQAVTLTITGPFYFASCTEGSGSIALNAGQRAFAYTAPSGFKALCTQNLPTPTIGATSTTQANDYFDVTLYTGTDATQSITNSGSMQPDFVWVKARNGAYNHYLYDVIRGSTNALRSNTTGAESQAGDSTLVLQSTGFQVTGTGLGLNSNGTTIVGWQWKGGGTGVTNTAGTITSTVSANTTSGFSIATYTGNGSSTGTVGHGLGVTPSMVITKNRNGYNASQGFLDWSTYHISLPSYNTTGAQALYLMSTQAAGGAGGFFNRPTSTVFTPNQTAYDNVSGQTYVAYCFAPVAGYSAFGSYTGNGSTDGPFVYLGFRPAFVLWKRSNGAESWWINDIDRLGYNGANRALFPNASNAEDTANNIDILSNGFKIRGSGGEVNASGGTYIYACFAENPFKYSLAR